jgi:hypothetical protein
MVDQMYSEDMPLHLILGSPAELQKRYADDHEEIKELIGSFNDLAACSDASDQKTRREELAVRAEELKEDFSKRHFSELCYLLQGAGNYLKGTYPLHEVKILPSIGTPQ